MHKQAQLFNKTRIAPTPSGFLHLGNALSFALTAALAHKTGAKILLRIDDLDQQRINLAYVQDIFDTLNFMGIPWDEGPRDVGEYKSTWSQLHRMALYQDALQILQNQGDVFACQCSRAQIRGNNGDVYPSTCRDKGIPLDTVNTSWRLHTDPEKELAIHTLHNEVVKTHLPAAMNNFIVKKKDGYPAYQLASLLDDMYYDVDLIVRGQDLWPSTVAQHYLAKLLHKDIFLNSTFYHHPLLMENSGQKLSKSAGATSIHYLRGQGKKPADIYAEIGRMMDLKETVTNWQELAEIISV